MFHYALRNPFHSPSLGCFSLFRTSRLLQNPLMWHPNYTILPLLSWEEPSVLVPELPLICARLPWRLYCSKLRAETMGNADMDINFSVPLLTMLPSLKGNMKNSLDQGSRSGLPLGSREQKWLKRQKNRPPRGLYPSLHPSLLTYKLTYQPTHIPDL